MSGIEFGGSIIAIVQSGPVLWTGGDYGPEGGLIGTGAMLVGMALMLAWIRLHDGNLSVERFLTQPPVAPQRHECEEEAEPGGEDQDLWMNS